MSLILLFSLLAACAIVMIIERAGVPMVLQLDFKGDIKRESRWFAQYGQFACSAVAALLVWQLEPDFARKQRILWILLASVGGASVASTIIKRLVGRVRPNRENAGKFLGFTLKHANYRESFPSSHSACAIALSVALMQFYPSAAITFWGLGLLCAGLRYLLDAHWLSDVLGGIALGYACAHLSIQFIH